MTWIVAPSGKKKSLPVGSVSVMKGTANRVGYVGFGTKTVESWGLTKYNSVVVLNCKETPQLIGFQFREDDKGRKIHNYGGMLRVHCQSALRMANARVGHYSANREPKTGMITVSVDCQLKESDASK